MDKTSVVRTGNELKLLPNLPETALSTSVAPFPSPVLHLLLTFFILGTSLVAQLVKNLPTMQEIPSRFLDREDPLEKDRLPTPAGFGFPGGSAGKKSTHNAGDLVQSLGWEDPLEKGKAPHSSILAWRIPWTV